jgi:hypothetical protein
MKKSFTVGFITLILVLTITGTVFATKPEYVIGFVDFASVGSDGIDFWYDVCDPVLVGHVVQPANPPGKAVHGHFVSGNSIYCPYTTELEGTCEFTLIPVETIGDPNSKPGRGVVKQCTGDLAGLHGILRVNEWYQYQAWYHFDP